MRKHLLLLLIISFILLYPQITQITMAARGLEPVLIKDKQGKQVGLYNESYALVIGVSKYTNGWPPLRGVMKDVKTVSKALEENGFQVKTVIDPDKDGLEQAFEGFISDYGGDPGNRLLFYFAGHGHTIKPKYGGAPLGYIVPREAPNPNLNAKNLKDFKRIAMSMKQIEVYAVNTDSKHALFLFDSCFSGSIFNLSRAVPKNISYKTSQPVRQFITSGDEEEEVPDRSIFRRQFIRAIKGEADVDGDKYVTGTELGEYLQKNVVNYSNGTQHPVYGKIRNPHLDKGDFVFALKSDDFRTETPGFALPPKVKDNENYYENIAREREGALKKWNSWQSGMTGMYSNNIEMDGKRVLKPSEKVEMWKGFLTKYSTDNPHSTEDQLMRSKAVERINYWKNYKKLEPAPVVAAPQPDTSSPAVTGGASTIDGASIIDGAAKPDTTYKDPVTGMEYVFVKGGCYEMGDTFGDGYDDEKPVHEVCLDDFYIGKYEVTQGEWESVMGSNPSHFKNGNDYPVEWVSWDEVQDFIEKLNKQSGKRHRLPTEAEWEYAARSGGKKEKFAGFSSENELYRYANFCDTNCEEGWKTGDQNDGFENTSPVGKFIPNGHGIYDMTGNVWEWCQDIYSEKAYKKQRRKNPVYKGSGSYRVGRGGSWGGRPGLLRASGRDGDTPARRGDQLGFRLARTP